MVKYGTYLHHYPVIVAIYPRPKPRPPHAREIASARMYLEIHRPSQGWEWLISYLFWSPHVFSSTGW